MIFSKPLVALMLLARCFSSPIEDQQQQCLLSEKPSEEMVIIESTFSYLGYSDCGRTFAYLQGEQAPFVDFYKTGSFTPTYFDALSSLEQLILDSQVLVNAFNNDQCSADLTKYKIVGDETNRYSDSSQELSVIGWMIDVKRNQDFTARECPAEMNFREYKNPQASFFEIAENQKRAQKKLELDLH
jgi:hypothetical protein